MTDNKTVVELLEPVDRDYKAWRMFVESEQKYEEKLTESHKCDKIISTKGDDDMGDKPKFDENKYRQQYKKDHFDHIGFFAPKGTKDIITRRSKELGMGLSEYMRYLIEQDTKTPTE